ncbi:hypothetical protein ACEPAG_4576 [Sanghuangporus baumii]
MPSTDTYDENRTFVDFPWPKGITPLERIMLSASGDLQRILSAFFARPVIISPMFAKTTPPSKSPAALSPSPTCPTTQKRQVHLICDDRMVCIATSSVTITSPLCAKLFLQEGYAIGQIFRKLGVVPEFELLEAGLVGDGEHEHEHDDTDVLDEKARLGADHGKRKIWRRYTLKIEGFAADILEVFPDREMFTRGEEWLVEPRPPVIAEEDIDLTESEGTPGLSPTETLVQLDEFPFETCVAGPYPEPAKESWSDSSNGLLRFMAVFIAVLLLLNVPKESSGDSAPTYVGNALFGRIARLLDVQGVSDDS